MSNHTCLPLLTHISHVPWVPGNRRKLLHLLPWGSSWSQGEFCHAHHYGDPCIFRLHMMSLSSAPSLGCLLTSGISDPDVGVCF